MKKFLVVFTADDGTGTFYNSTVEAEALTEDFVEDFERGAGEELEARVTVINVVELAG